MKRTRVITTLSALAITSTAGLLVAGPLNPPAGPVASTYKTLTEVEPRISINPINTPGDADSLFKITQAGSYYLAGNISGVVGKHGIKIVASNVTIDLNGFAVRGSTGTLDGIIAAGALTAVVIRNGSVSSWAADGLDLGSSIAPVIRDVIATGNGGRGVFVSNGARVVDCSASNNAGSGFQSGGVSSISNCASVANGAGFTTGSMDVISNCNASNNNGVGFVLGNGSTLRDCASTQNAHQGAIAASDCAITHNQVRGNGGASDAGIWIQGSYCRVEDNNLSDNGWGVYVSGQLNLIVHNRTMSSTHSNYHIQNANFLGEILLPSGIGLPIDGNSGGGLGTVDPNANYVY